MKKTKIRSLIRSAKKDKTKFEFVLTKLKDGATTRNRKGDIEMALINYTAGNYLENSAIDMILDALK